MLPRTRTPSYRLHRASGQAVVTLNGRDVYLGKYRSAESRQNFDRVIAEWLAAGRKLAPDESVGFTIVELIERWDTHARQHYRRPDGSQTSEFDVFRQALRPLRRLYGRTEVEGFGALQLQAVREEYIGLGWSRGVVNEQVNRIRRVFRWAVSQQLVPSGQLAELEAVAGLQRGRTTAREADKVLPVAEEHARAILPFVASPVAGMIELQLYTGMRPGELVIMCAADIDTTGAQWEYKPAQHKNQHRGHARIVPLGPRGQAIVERFLTTNPAAYLFNPSAAVAEVRERRHAERKTPITYGNTIGSNRKRKPDRAAGDRYTTESYRRAIERGCARAFPAPDGLDDAQVKTWHKQHRFAPNQIRHTYGTKVRKKWRLEGSQAALGQKHADVTQVYAEVNLDLARQIAAEVG